MVVGGEEMNNESQVRILVFANALQGISYLEWIKLKMAVDRNFDTKIRELEKEIQLSDADQAIIATIIRSQFG